MQLNSQKNIRVFIFSFAALFFLISGISAETQQNFYISKNYDLYNRNQLAAVLIKTSDRLYWYADKDWWNNPALDRSAYLNKIDELTSEFENKIYPNLTSKFGSEWNPGIDNDSRITILLQQMKKDVSGYWRSDDEYYTLQGAVSNEREMVYLNADKIQDPIAKSSLAHEFTHLIAFNQKEKKIGIGDDLWLQEMLADMSVSVLGYNDSFSGSLLEQRLKIFLAKPTDSLTEWNGDLSDYGVIDLFGQYLLDRYGWQVLADILKTQSTGINAINEALAKEGFKDSFSDVFTKWIVALAVNNCSIGQEYCYTNPAVAKIKITPSIYFLPLSGDSTISITLWANNWAASWYKFIGGRDTLKIDFNAPKNVNTRVVYVVELPENKFQVGELRLDTNRPARAEFPDFGTKNISIILMPTIQDIRLGDSSTPRQSYPLSWTISLKGNETSVVSSGANDNLAQLQQKIAELKAQIAVLQTKLSTGSYSGQSANIVCQKLETDLRYGMKGYEVSCLQGVLKGQGAEIYPEGLVTGNFLGLTKAAVIRFQEKYASEILKPVGLNRGTGFVGALTRQKINSMF